MYAPLLLKFFIYIEVADERYKRDLDDDEMRRFVMDDLLTESTEPENINPAASLRPGDAGSLSHEGGNSWDSYRH